MTILDHRILIPKSPEKIWEFLSDLSQNASWQVDCKSVSILTTKQTGPGVRWRYTTTSGRSYVAEITAWYDGLGYEYTFVDGTPFSENKGRIRLQEIAEGTVVQWTLTYETSGVLAGVRNAVGLKRQFETSMVDSLKNLWKVLQKVMPDDKPREVKSLMRDAPDYESRTQYRPRHPSAKPETGAELLPQLSVPHIIEPPISADDTRPRVPVRFEPDQIPESPAPPTPVVSQSFDDPDTGTIEPVIYPLPVEKQPEAKEFVPRPPDKEIDPDFAPARRSTQEMKAVVPIPEPELELPQPIEPPSAKPEPVAETPLSETPKPPSTASTGSFDTVKMATSEMSVFELFGIPRPSQTQEIDAVILPAPVAEIVEPPVATPASTRIGLRLVLRRNRVRVRRPT